ncbi:MAG: uracil phosphoribosyltransferase [Gemmatimonadota bacterium]|jgi:uracil phosphoribosyltransferase
MVPPSALPGLTIAAHPLVRHKVALLRDAATPKKLFAELAEELAMLLAYEATADLALEPVTVPTPLESTPGERLPSEALTLVPILRAGLGMVPGVLRLVPTARVGHIGLFRDHDSLEPVEYYFKIPAGAERGQVFLLDPMLATGGSAVNAATALKQRGITRLKFLCLVAAPEGVRRFHAAHPEVPILTAALDRELNAHGYILPGLGDAGDRLFGTK